MKEANFKIRFCNFGDKFSNHEIVVSMRIDDGEEFIVSVPTTKELIEDDISLKEMIPSLIGQTILMKDVKDGVI